MSRTLFGFVLVATVSLAASWGQAADTDKKGELPPPLGAALERDGLKFVLTMPKAQVLVGQPLAFEISVENISKNDRTLVESSCLDADFWTIEMTDEKGIGWRVVAPPRAAGPPSVPVVLKAGEKQIIRFAAGEHYRFTPVNADRAPLLEFLPTGKYVLSAKKTFPARFKNAAAQQAPIWSGDVVLDKISFTAIAPVK
jgi:hypothetical protein